MIEESNIMSSLVNISSYGFTIFAILAIFSGNIDYMFLIHTLSHVGYVVKTYAIYKTDQDCLCGLELYTCAMLSHHRKV